MKDFFFSGPIQASKSMMNRALILKSFDPQLQIQGHSNCEDVEHMRSALTQFQDGMEIHCGDAGTVFRFLSLRASRESGSFFLTGTDRLLSRPHQDLSQILEKLSVQFEFQKKGLLIRGEGWKKPTSNLEIPRTTSSQFASGLLLSSWNLPFDFQFKAPPGVSQGYWDMTLHLVKSAGMKVENSGSHWTIPADQKVEVSRPLHTEPDYSSAFAVAAAGALCGKVILQNMTSESEQPDFRFLEILKKMNVSVISQGSQMTIKMPDQLTAIQCDLSSSPDLFPILAVLCAFAEGTSRLRGAAHLAFKESNRIQKTAELLRNIKIPVEVFEDGIQITGNPKLPTDSQFNFDPDQDHRMAMAAGLLMLKGFPIQLRNPEVVNKSFPEFWKVLGVPL